MRTQARRHVGEGDARVGEVDAAQPRADDVVLQPHDQVLRLVRREDARMLLRHLPAPIRIEDVQTPTRRQQLLLEAVVTAALY